MAREHYVRLVSTLECTQRAKVIPCTFWMAWQGHAVLIALSLSSLRCYLTILKALSLSIRIL